MGCLKGATVAGLVVPTADYVRFATHYGFRPDFCEGNDPESKGLVENLVGYVKSDLMIPAELTVADLAAANAAGVVWRAEVNAVVHSEISAVPDERLAVERDLLRPLPSLRARIGKLVLRKVDRLSCVRFGSARYSVPTRHIGRQVEVRVADGARRGDPPRRRRSPHIPLSRLGKRRSSTTTTAARGPTPARAVRPKTTAEIAFCALGPAAVAFIKAAAAAGNSSLGSGPRRARRPRSRPRPRRPDRRPGTGRHLRSSPGERRPLDPRRRHRRRPPDPTRRSAHRSRCPPSPPDPCRTTRSAKPHDRPDDAGTRRRSRGRPPPAAARRHAPPRPRAARHRQDPTVVARRVPPHPHRSRDRVTRRVQRPGTAQGRRVPRHQDHRRVRPRRRRRSSRRRSTT